MMSTLPPQPRSQKIMNAEHVEAHLAAQKQMAAKFDVLKKKSTMLVTAIGAAAKNPEFAMLGLQSNGHYHCVLAVQGAEILVRCDIDAEADRVVGKVRSFLLPTPPEKTMIAIDFPVEFDEAGNVTIDGRQCAIDEAGTPFCILLFDALHRTGKLSFLGLRTELTS
jgi:hypothetical protein